MEVQEGCTFYSNYGSDSHHLHIVLTNIQDNQFLGVNVTTLRSHSDTTVVLDKNHHPEINRPSSINYSDSKIWPIEDYIYFQEIHMIIPCDHMMNHEVVKIIGDGLLKSDRTPNEIKQYFSDYCKNKTDQ